LEFGVSKWGQISRALQSTEELPRRSGKQCRERWHNHLDPKINKNSWTEKEKSFILDLHHIHGNHWSLISKYLPGRSDNAVKNLFYSTLRKNSRQEKNEQILKVKTIKSKKIKEIDVETEASAILISLSKSRTRFQKSGNGDYQAEEKASPEIEGHSFRMEPVKIPIVYTPNALVQYFTKPHQLDEHPVLFF